jgi:hypothetical protein
MTSACYVGTSGIIMRNMPLMSSVGWVCVATFRRSCPPEKYSWCHYPFRCFSLVTVNRNRSACSCTGCSLYSLVIDVLLLVQPWFQVPVEAGGHRCGVSLWICQSLCGWQCRSFWRVPVGHHECIVTKCCLDCAASSVRRQTVVPETCSSVRCVHTVELYLPGRWLSGLAWPFQEKNSYCNCATSFGGLNISRICHIHIRHYVLTFYFYANK